MSPGTQMATALLEELLDDQDDADETPATSEALIPDMYEIIRADIASDRAERMKAAAARQRAEETAGGAWRGRFDHLADTPVGTI